MSGYTKRRPGAPPGFFAAEAAGLVWLAAAGPAAARVVGVLDVGAEHIALEQLHPARPTAAAAEAFGRALAATHAAGAEAYGSPPPDWEGDAWIGRQPLRLEPTDRFGSFYAEQRLLPYARRAVQLGHLSPDGLAAVERVCDRLVGGEFDDDRAPARIHGDLWAGNVLFTADGAVLIDPAAHGGHGLTDLAMLHLFGAPHLDRITAAYAEAAELPSGGWRDLIGLHQLHPLLVHAVSHGPGYGVEAAAVAFRYA
ncbi:MAG: fructosamine kinase family protein [Actinomycetes bacterium]